MSIIIRILPMDKINEFQGQNFASVQSDFFLKEVPSRVLNNDIGIYCFKSNKIKVDDQETYILFQYDNHIIACAKLDKTVLVCTHKEYGGYYVLPPETIYTFDKISLNDLNTYVFPLDPIKRFCQVCHKRTLLDINSFLNNTKVVKNLEGVNQSNIILNREFQCEPR